MPAISVTEFEGVYEVPEAALYIHADLRLPQPKYHVRSRHLIHWIRRGLAHKELAGVPGHEMLITFEDLVSMRVIAFLRALNYSFPRIRKAEIMLRRITGHPRPFATERLWAEDKGAGEIYAEIGDILMAATKGGQLPFVELVRERLINVHGLTFDQRSVADSWTPRDGILLHPRIQFGRPCIAGTRIPTADLAGMVEAGDKEDFLAASYGLRVQQVQTAVAWERELRRLAAA